jgi:hypothetical protein
MSEERLVGGDVNVVVRVGDTVRRPPGPSGVRSLLEWYERVGFDGAPRFLGFDEQGRADDEGSRRSAGRNVLGGHPHGRAAR